MADDVCISLSVVDHTGASEASIVIVNPASVGTMVAFKIKTTSPSRYVVKPPTQVLRVGESLIVKGVMIGSACAPSASVFLLVCARACRGAGTTKIPNKSERVRALKRLALWRASDSGEIALLGSYRLHCMPAATPVFSAHGAVTVTNKYSDIASIRTLAQRSQQQIGLAVE